MKKAKFKRWAPLYLMMAPGLIYLFINNYMPMAGLVVAFKNYNVVDGIFGSPWAGLSNFTYLFNDAWTITRNTLLYNIVFIIINLILGIAFAIFICDIRSKACKQFIKVQFYCRSYVYCNCKLYHFCLFQWGQWNAE